MEIITGVERRRRWRTDEKLRIVAESEVPGAVISMVARRHGVARSQIFEWRRQARSGELAAMAMVPEFLPLRSTEPAELPAALPLSPEPPVSSTKSSRGFLELSFPGGVTLRVEGKADVATLLAVIAAAKG